MFTVLWIVEWRSNSCRTFMSAPKPRSKRRIVFKMRKLADIFVERDGKTSGGIVLAAQGFSDRGSAFLAGIPGFQDGV